MNNEVKTAQRVALRYQARVASLEEKAATSQKVAQRYLKEA